MATQELVDIFIEAIKARNIEAMEQCVEKVDSLEEVTKLMTGMSTNRESVLFFTLTSHDEKIMAFTHYPKVNLAVKMILTSEELRYEDPKTYKLLHNAFILHTFVRLGNHRGVSKVLDKYPKIFEYTAEDSIIYIQECLKNKNDKILSLLIKKGCPVDKKLIYDVHDRLYSLNGCASSSF